jgi:hypothetical protein
MKQFIQNLATALFCVVLLTGISYAQKDVSVELKKLDEFTVSEGGLFFNNFDCRLEDNSFVGKTTEFRCSIKNKSEGKKVFALFVAGFDEKEQMIVAYSLRNMAFNPIEPGETREVAEVAISKGTERIKYFKIRIIVREYRI